MIRTFVLLAVLSGVVFWLNGEQQKGRFREVDERFLDFLVSNARDRFAPDPTAPSKVVFARIHESDKADYAAWPPPPIDLNLMVKSIAAHEPSVLVIAAPLNWGEPAPEFVTDLADTLLPLPHVIAGIDVTVGKGSGADSPALGGLPLITRLQDDTQSLFTATEVRSAPVPAIANKVELGCLDRTKPTQLAMAYRVARGAVPSVILQALAASTSTPFAQQRLVTGNGAGLHLGSGVYVPLDEHGLLRTVAENLSQVPTVNALDLITPSLALDNASENAQALGTGKIIVLGMDDAASLALGIDEALARPRIRELLGWQQWAVWGLAVLLGLHLLSRPRGKALSRMLLLLFLSITASYLAFQNNLTWCPPAIPGLIIAISGVFVRLFGRAKTSVVEGTADAASGTTAGNEEPQP